MHASRISVVVFTVILACLAYPVHRPYAASFQVTSPGDSPTGATLRWAIYAADTNPGSDTITFNLPAPYTITPTGILPAIEDTSPTLLDGTTQPGYSNIPIVRLDGSKAGASAHGLSIASDSNQILGIWIGAFNGDGIHIYHGDGNVIAGNYILSNQDWGINLPVGSGNLIGGTNELQRNVISSNGTGGIFIGSGAASTLIRGNYIGHAPDGVEVLGNAQNGIRIEDSPGNIIGGSDSGCGNVIAGSTYGILLLSSNSTDNLIRGNYIGTDPAGAVAAANTYGVTLQHAPGNTIGGTNTADRNLISGNSYGIYIQYVETTGTVIQGNYIGTDASGTHAISNTVYGIYVTAPANYIGGIAAGAGNLISGNNIGIMISSSNAGGNKVRGNYIGTDADGSNAVPNTTGIRITYSGGNIIGAITSLPHNVISGNREYGVYLSVNTYDNTIFGNYIGTDASGLHALSNGLDGVFINLNASSNTIGGDSPAARNIISGNGRYGIYVFDSTGNVVRSDFIGINAAGDALPNADIGIRCQRTAATVIGGDSTNQRNVISANEGSGIDASESPGILIKNNYIGLGPDGSTARGNGISGICLDEDDGFIVTMNAISENGSSGIRLTDSRDGAIDNNKIGTDAAGAAARGNGDCGIYVAGSCVSNTIGPGNLISANTNDCIRLEGSNVTHTTIVGNWIGVDAYGASALPNLNGINLNSAPLNTIGGTNSGDANVIAGNSSRGIYIHGVSAVSNIVRGNHIGVDISGSIPIGNSSHGIHIADGASNNIIGGLPDGAGNIIANNGACGVRVASGSGNTILRNSIFANEDLGIDLDVDGVTTNDPGDEDTGANNIQNFPVITSVSNDGVNLRTIGYLSSRTNRLYMVDLFAVTGPDQSGYGEGETSLVRFAVQTYSDGRGGFTNVIALPDPIPNFITATASDINDGDTSEFSAPVILDSDGDGMPDGWEKRNFGNPLIGNPNGDKDGDGVSNYDEWLADTQPTNSLSVLALNTITTTGAYVNLEFFPYSLERDYDLYLTDRLESDPWQPWGTTIGHRETTGTVSFFTSTYSGMFFRMHAHIPQP